MTKFESEVPLRLTDSMIDPSLCHYFKAVVPLGIGDWLMERLLFVFYEGSILLYLLLAMKGTLPWAVQTWVGWAVWLSCHSVLHCF